MYNKFIAKTLKYERVVDLAHETRIEAIREANRICEDRIKAVFPMTHWWEQEGKYSFYPELPPPKEHTYFPWEFCDFDYDCECMGDIE